MGEVKKRSMFEINEEFLRLQQALIDADGELTNDQMDQLMAAHEDGEQKVINYGRIMKQMQIEAKSLEARKKIINEESKRVAAMERKLKKRHEYMISTLESYFLLSGAADNIENVRQVFKHEDIVFAYRKSTSNDMLEDVVPPEEFYDQPDPVLDTKRLLAWCKEKQAIYDHKVAEAQEHNELHPNDPIDISQIKNENIYYKENVTYKLQLK